MIPRGMFGEYIRKWPDDDGTESRLKKKKKGKKARPLIMIIRRW